MIRLVALLLALWPVKLFGQTVTVRSGDHPGFTRLVLTQPTPAPWDFGRSETGYVIKMRSSITGFDTSTVFNRISRERLTGLSVQPGAGLLNLELGCDCHAIATPFRPGIIVIDIAEGDAPVDSPFEDILIPAAATADWIQSEGSVRPPRRPQSFGASTALPALGPRRLHERSALRPHNQRLIVPDVRASLLAESLSRELSRGIAAGAISATPAAPRPTATRPQLLPKPLKPSPPISGPQIATRTAGAEPSREPPETGIACIAPDQLALNDWGDGRPAWLQIPEKRGLILAEFDRPDMQAILTLSRLYLHFGFGAEARQVILSWPVRPAETSLIEALSHLIDGSQSPPFFTGMQACDGPAAVWSALEQDNLPLGTDSAAVLRSFSELPPWIRRDLGTRLAERFIASGDISTAESLEQIIGRIVPDQAPESSLIRGEIDLAQGRPEEAKPHLDRVARSNSELAPHAMATLLDSKLASGEQITREEIDALAALVQAHQSEPIGRKLLRTLALSLVAAGDEDRAFHEIAPRTPALYPDLWEALADRGSDIAVASLTYAPPAGSLKDLASETYLQLAERLIAVGFPARALRLIEPLAGAEVDLARAEAHLHLRDGRAALRNLAGASGPKAGALRAEALELLGELQGAYTAWLEAGDEARAARINLLRQQWTKLPASAPSELKALAPKIAGSLSILPEPMEQARSQIEAAGEIRGFAEALLQNSLIP